MKTWIVSKLRKFLQIESDKKFLLEYGDVSASRIDHLEASNG